MNRRIFQIQYEVNYGGEIAYHEEMVTTSGVIGVVEQYALEEVKTYWPDDTTWIESDRCGERGDGCARIRVSRIEEVIMLHLRDLDSPGTTVVHLLPCTVLTD